MYIHTYICDPVRLWLRHLYQVEFCSFVVRYPTAGASVYCGHISSFFISPGICILWILRSEYLYVFLEKLEKDCAVLSRALIQHIYMSQHDNGLVCFVAGCPLVNLYPFVSPSVSCFSVTTGFH